MILGPIGGASVASKRRTRHRKVWIVVLLVVIALVLGELINQVVNSSQSVGRTTADTWVAAVTPIVASSTSLAGPVRLVRQQAISLTRPELVGALDSLVESTRTELSNLAAVGVAPSSRLAASRLTQVFALRSKAATDLRHGVELAIGTPPAPGEASALIEAAGTTMERADRIFGSMARALGSHGSSRLPPSRWIAQPQSWSGGTVTRFTAALGGAHQLAAARALSIVALSLDPLPEVIPTTTTTTTTTTTSIPVASTSTSTSSTTTTIIVGGTRSSTSTTTPSTTTTTTTTLAPPSQQPYGGGVSRIGPTSSLTVILVIANRGNVTSSLATITAQLDTAQQTTARVSPLAPGSSTYLRLPALHVSPKKMARCPATQPSTFRCATLAVSVAAGGTPTVTRQVSLAFFVN